MLFDFVLLSSCLERIKDFSSIATSWIMAIATVFYVIYTYGLFKSTKQSIDKNNRLAEFQIYMKINDALFFDKALAIIDKIEHNDLLIIESEYSMNSPLYKPESTILGKELRMYLLGPLEDLAKFHDDGLISLESIDSGFGNTILKVLSNRVIVDYIIHLRRNVHFSENLFCGIQSLFEKILENCEDGEKSKYINYFKV